MNLPFRIFSLPVFAFVLATSVPAQAKLAANGATANSLESNRLASNRLASNRLASNRLASNRLASNRLASNGLQANLSAGDGAFSGVASIVLPDRTRHH